MKLDLTRILRLGALVMAAVIMVVVGACSSSPDRPDGAQMPDEVPSLHIEPQRGVFIRAGFDDDPSDYIGQFINDDVPEDEIDETRGVQTTCSQYIEYREVNAGGTYDEVYQASRSAGASLGVSPQAQAAGASGQAAAGSSDGAMVRVEYTLSKRMRGVMTPEYEECCRQNVGGCSGRYLAEFWKGTGELYQFVGTESEFSAGGSVPGVSESALEFSDGAAWSRAMSFEDMYFAFTVSDAAIVDQDCGWVDAVPTSDEGVYFVGVSPPAASESAARSLAMREARVQVVQYLGEQIKASTATRSSAMEGYLDDEQVIETMAQGVAERVEDDRYCPVETTDSPEGTLYTSRVLAFFPQQEMEAAARESLDKLEESLDAQGQLSEDERDELESIRTDIEVPEVPDGVDTSSTEVPSEVR